MGEPGLGEPGEEGVEPGLEASAIEPTAEPGLEGEPLEPTEPKIKPKRPLSADVQRTGRPLSEAEKVKLPATGKPIGGKGKGMVKPTDAKYPTEKEATKDGSGKPFNKEVKYKELTSKNPGAPGAKTGAKK